jgi:hypothetical protein
VQSDANDFLSVLVDLLSGIHQEWGALAVVVLGIILVVGVAVCALALRWTMRGGLGDGARHRFFAERREVKGWLGKSERVPALERE